MFPQLIDDAPTSTKTCHDVRDLGFFILEIILQEAIKDKDRSNDGFVSNTLDRIQNTDLKDLLSKCCKAEPDLSIKQVAESAFF